MTRITRALLVTLTLAVAPLTVAAAPASPADDTDDAGWAQRFAVNHVALRTQDLDRAQRFWEDVFGAREQRRSRIPNIDPAIEIVFLELSHGFHIELIGGGSPTGPAPARDIARDYTRTGYRHIAFQVDDMADVLEGLGRRGLSAEYRVEREDYGLDIALLRDPDGNFIELYAPIAKR